MMIAKWMFLGWFFISISAEKHQQEWETLFAGLANNRHHKRLAWRMLTRHWDAVEKVWGQSQFKMKAIISHAVSKADPEEVQSFFERHPCDLV